MKSTPSALGACSHRLVRRGAGIRTDRPWPAHVRDTHRVIAIGTSVSFGAADVDHSFAGVWKTLITEGGELVCAQTGTRHPALPKPKAVVLDVRRLERSLLGWPS